jgi:hypothetical protein
MAASEVRDRLIAVAEDAAARYRQSTFFVLENEQQAAVVTAVATETLTIVNEWLDGFSNDTRPEIAQLREELTK